MDWFGWLTKPKLQVSVLDHVIMYAEIFILLFIYVFIYTVLDQIRIGRIKKKHGGNCTCWTCMGVRK